MKMFDQIRCSKCGEKNDKKNKFCSECGSPLGGIVCSSCNMRMESDYKFCPGCGASTGQLPRVEAMPARGDMERTGVWRRGSNDFAHRFEVSDIKGVFNKTVTVEQGTKAIFLQEGRFSGELPPGKYSVGGLIQAIKTLNLSEKATIVLVDDSDVRLDFNIGGLRTLENFDTGVKGKVVITMEEPILFFNNLMKRRERTSITDIEVMLRDEMRNLFQSKVKRHSFEDLYGNLELKRELEQDFEYLLNTTLSRVGIKFIHMPYFDYDESYWRDIIEAQGDSARGLIKKREEIRQDANIRLVEYEEDIRAKEKEATLGEREIGIDDKREVLDVKRSELAKRIRARLTDDKMDEIHTAQDLERFIHSVDTEKVIRENEMRELKEVFEENREDKKIARIQMLQKIEIRHELDMDAERAERERRKKIADAKTTAEIDQMEIGIGLKAIRDLKAAKREDVAGYQELEIEKMKREAEIEEMKLKARSAATDEALISVAGGKEAEHISELARMKLATGLTDEQILALGARDSAAIAEAFKERYKAKSAEEIMKIYEGRLGDKDKLVSVIQEMADKGSDRLERMAAKALEQMGTTAATRAQSGAPGGTTVVTGGGLGQPVVVGGGVTPTTVETKKVIMCLECNAELPFGTRFCTGCGAVIGKRGS